MAELKRDERDRLVARLDELRDRMAETEGPERARHREAFYQALGEYADRLPRVGMGLCPFTAEPLQRAIDPFGFDGYWWPAQSPAEFEEPRAPEAFRVLLGAVRLNREAPTEAKDVVHPGPDVPFVVPALLGLPGMVAVIDELRLASGDTAWPIAYFSTEETDPAALHQPWCRDEWWFDKDGDPVWSIASDPWDFALRPWLESGRLRWVDRSGEAPVVRTLADGVPCPFLDLEGERAPQEYADGERSWLPLPDGEPLVPFGEPDDEPPPSAEKLAELKAEVEKLSTKFGATLAAWDREGDAIDGPGEPDPDEA